MTYLELVNGVLTRMREDTVGTLASTDDPVVQIVMDHVNDAKRLVEDAHTWNALRTEWTFTTQDGVALYPLTNAGNYAILEWIDGNDGSMLTNRQLRDIKRLKAQGDDGSACLYYAVNGQDANGDVQLEIYPTPSTQNVTYTVGGFARRGDLSADNDVVAVPSKPVLYFALANSLRERGEVGGQTASEIFAMASTYLSDAIALDANNSHLDNIWYS